MPNKDPRDYEGRGVSGLLYPRGEPTPVQGPFTDPVFENQYKQWALSRAMAMGLGDFDNPNHHYDYREAYLYGAEPDLVSRHWPSNFKAADHPNRYVDGMDTITGKPAPVIRKKNSRR